MWIHDDDDDDDHDGDGNDDGDGAGVMVMLMLMLTVTVMVMVMVMVMAMVSQDWLHVSCLTYQPLTSVTTTLINDDYDKTDEDNDEQLWQNFWHTQRQRW